MILDDPKATMIYVFCESLSFLIVPHKHVDATFPTPWYPPKFLTQPPLPNVRRDQKPPLPPPPRHLHLLPRPTHPRIPSPPTPPPQTPQPTTLPASIPTAHNHHRAIPPSSLHHWPTTYAHLRPRTETHPRDRPAPRDWPPRRLRIREKRRADHMARPWTSHDLPYRRHPACGRGRRSSEVGSDAGGCHDLNASEMGGCIGERRGASGRLGRGWREEGGS